jgi:hypothetical protein
MTTPIGVVRQVAAGVLSIPSNIDSLEILIHPYQFVDVFLQFDANVGAQDGSPVRECFVFYYFVDERLGEPALDSAPAGSVPSCSIYRDYIPPAPMFQFDTQPS